MADIHFDDTRMHRGCCGHHVGTWVLVCMATSGDDGDFIPWYLRPMTLYPTINLADLVLLPFSPPEMRYISGIYRVAALDGTHPLRSLRRSPWKS